ncbi:MAG: hypothetical protein PHF26_03995 [Candidatus Gracilibacteria bacterium]|nr:hypothetical protein [Candidatus Gracilibacteria bacterium]
MDKNSIKKIIKDCISTKTGNEFQDFCDRFCLKLYPNDYTPVRAGGKNGDLKNDGYCPKARIFFQAHGTRNEQARKTKEKIEKDLAGCVEKHPDIQKWIYLTNQTLIGEIEAFVDLLRLGYPKIIIETWGHLKIAEKIANFENEIISEIIDINLSDTLTEEQELTILDYIFEDILKIIKNNTDDYSYSTSIDLDKKIKINFSSKNDQDEVRDYLKYALSKLKLVNDRMAIEESSNQDDIHSYIVSLYQKHKRSGETNIEILVSLFDDILPKTKKNDIHYQNLSKAFVLFFFDDCTIFEKTRSEKYAYTH